MRKKLVSILISMAMLGQMAVPAYASDTAAVSTERPVAVSTEAALSDSAEADADSPAVSADPVSVPETGGTLNSPDGSYSPEDASDATSANNEDVDSMIVDATDDSDTNIPEDDADGIIEDESVAKSFGIAATDGIDPVEEDSADEESQNLAENYFVVDYDDDIIVNKGESPVLRVDVQSSNPDNVSYAWYEGIDDENDDDTENNVLGTAAQYIVPTVSHNCEYHCVITDASGRKETAEFYIRINSQLLSIPDRLHTISVKEGDKVLLDSSDLIPVWDPTYSYQWSFSALGSSEEQQLSGAQGYYTINNVQSSDNGWYIYAVTDSFGNTSQESFELKVLGKGEDALLLCGNQWLTAELSNPITLSVEPITNDSETPISYHWYNVSDDDGESLSLIEGVSGPNYTTTLNETGEYAFYCSARQGDLEDEIYFWVTVMSSSKELKVTYPSSGQKRIILPVSDAGKELSLNVKAEGGTGTLSYTWYSTTCNLPSYNDNIDLWYYYGILNEEYDDWEVLKNTKGDSCSANPKKSTVYACVVSDSEGSEPEVAYFLVSFASGLNVQGGGSIFKKTGDKATLNASSTSEHGTVSYEWYQWIEDEEGDSYYKELPAKDAELTVTVGDQSVGYLCTVSDEYNSKDVSFDVIPVTTSSENEDSPLMLEAEKTIYFSSREKQQSFFRISPEKSGVYWIRFNNVDEGKITIYDSDGTRIWAAISLSDTELELEQGKTYTLSLTTNTAVESAGLKLEYDHTHDWRLRKRIKATCTREGENTYICNYCNETLNKTIPIDANNHADIVSIPAVTAACTTAGSTAGRKCNACGTVLEQPQTIPALGHSFGPYVTTRAATALAEGIQTSTCSRCGAAQTRAIAKLPATISLNVYSIPLKTKQSTTKVVVSGLAAGDYVASWTSDKTKVATVSASGKIKAGKKTGKARITVRTAGGASAVLTVTVKKSKVKATKITGVPKSITLQKGQKYSLSPQVTPITTPDKTKYSTSSKKVAAVSKKGVISAKKKGSAKIKIKVGKKTFTVKVKVR